MWEFRDDVCETPEDYEAELVALKNRLDAYLRSPEDFEGMEKLVEHILGQRNRFPEVFDRHRDIEPMLGDIMSRQVQSDFFKNFIKPKEE
jgi:hypothetical protein